MPSNLVVLGEEADGEKVLPTLRGFQARVITTDLSDEQEATLRQALEE